MSITELQALSRQMQRAIDERTRQRKITLTPLDELPADIAALLCPRCHDFTSVLGCPKHPTRQARMFQ